MSTFVAQQTKNIWIWLAMNRATRQIVGCFIGHRDAARASLLWQSLPTPYRDAVCHTDGLSAYKGVVFGALHVIGGTQHIERLNATLRLRIAHWYAKVCPSAANQSISNSLSGCSFIATMRHYVEATTGSGCDQRVFALGGKFMHWERSRDQQGA
ncbi:IS1 family transposase [Deinococcus sp. QL22]|uniref:IS1 family transposase n=1 Tax=Deinococcus sp. QL22 TaxID=2939437 RepID=UPI002017A71C|nr:IS1 family transposase [Deinococcus sp. QL22]UQN09805.1 IS1 family transposase [Deinococcus sp. QL22]